jgi:4-hydroxybenzoate polyprenyltransferase
VAAHVLLRLSRIPAAGFTAGVPVWGFIAGAHGAGFDLVVALWSWPVALLLAVGTLAHIFGSVHNEVCDRDLDAKADYGSLKPLQAGEASVEAATRFAAAAAVAGVALSALLAAMTSWLVLPLVGLSLLLAAAYNRFGKRFVGGEAFFGLWQARAS